jgi:hypothetical protein
MQKKKTKSNKSRTNSVGSKSSASSTADDPEASGGLKTYKDVVYIFVARDSDMFVFEYHVD